MNVRDTVPCGLCNTNKGLISVPTVVYDYKKANIRLSPYKNGSNGLPTIRFSFPFPTTVVRETVKK